MTAIATATYAVRGMTCHHCAAAVDEEVGRVAGVSRVDVDLAAGRLEVTGEAVAEDEVRRAVEEAGYELASDR